MPSCWISGLCGTQAVASRPNHLPNSLNPSYAFDVLAPLLPERHPVRDFFIELDALDVVPRSDMGSMAHPVFSLSPRPDMRTLRYEHGDTFVEIQPSAKGLATIYDKDIIIFCISQLMDRLNRGERIGPVVRITTHDLLVATNRGTGGINYKRLEYALDRLAGTRIKTNIRTGDETSTQNFGLIEWYDYNRKGSGHSERLRYLDIKLSDWLFRAVTSAEVLPISRDYFRLRRPIDRRLYELARKHCGKQPSWRIGAANLQKKCGSKQAGKHFAAHLRGLVRTNHLPDYTISFDGAQVQFMRRSGGSIITAIPQAVLETPVRKPVRISADAYERAREIAPGWDRYALENIYIGWASGLEPARCEDARFLGWLRSYTRGKPAP
jgi:plasmid replication initiation protein